jgi:hypothetical protein
MGSCQGTARSPVVDIALFPVQHQQVPDKVYTALGGRPNNPNSSRHTKDIYVLPNPTLDLPGGVPTIV